MRNYIYVLSVLFLLTNCSEDKEELSNLMPAPIAPTPLTALPFTPAPCMPASAGLVDRWNLIMRVRTGQTEDGRVLRPDTVYDLFAYDLYYPDDKYEAYGSGGDVKQSGVYHLQGDTITYAVTINMSPQPPKTHAFKRVIQELTDTTLVLLEEEVAYRPMIVFSKKLYKRHKK